jgi:hypothetical protein
VSADGQRALALFVGDERWALQGGWQEPGLLGIRVALISGGDVARYSVRIPLDVGDADELVLGEPEVSEGWPE